MSDTPKTDNLCLDLDDGFARQSDLIAFARDLERENAALRDSIDHAETLLCNSLPMKHCLQSDWDNVIRKWRDQKHAARKEAKP